MSTTESNRLIAKIIADSSQSFKERIAELNKSSGSIERLENATNFNEIDRNALKSNAEIEALTIENKLKAEDLEGKRQDRCQRKIYASRALIVLLIYMLCVLAILFCNGFRYHNFSLDNSVLIALITTTTANVIGIFAFVMMYLFNTKHKES